MATVVMKFGGTSLATRSQIEKSIDIVLRDRERRFMVVSAPGSRCSGDVKVTDLLIRAAAEHKTGGTAAATTVVERFAEIVPEHPGLVELLSKELYRRLADVKAPNHEDQIAAFGEYASARMVVAIMQTRGLSARFQDPADVGFVACSHNGFVRPDPDCYGPMSRAMLDGFTGITVFPGFYAHTREGAIVTLPRGGSDTSGAVVARAVSATVYENWTDEDGLRRANPKIVSSPAFIPEMTYAEALELAYADFKLQDACFEPIRGMGIVLNVRNTNNPDHPGTRIMDTRAVDAQERILGVARQKGLVAINMRKKFIEQDVSFGRRLFAILETRNIPYEHQPNGVHTASIVLCTKFLTGENSLDNVMAEINRVCKPDHINALPLALVSAAGLGMQNHLDVNSRIFAALQRAGIKTLMIDEGAEDLSIFIGVEENHADDAVRAIYAEFYT